MAGLPTFQISNPKDTKARRAAQDLLDQAEEDLHCAICCLLKNPIEPLNEACYLLHQSLEKWIKVALQMDKGRFPYSHDLGGKLLPVFCNEDSTSGKALDLRKVKVHLDKYPDLIDENYPDQVRYRTDEGNNYPLDEHVGILLGAVFITRLLIKKWLEERFKDEEAGL